MNLERMKQVAVREAGEGDKWAVVCTDGDIDYAQTEDVALTQFTQAVQATEYLSGDYRHDYGLVRVDIDD